MCLSVAVDAARSKRCTEVKYSARAMSCGLEKDEGRLVILDRRMEASI